MSVAKLCAAQTAVQRATKGGLPKATLMAWNTLVKVTPLMKRNGIGSIRSCQKMTESQGQLRLEAPPPIGGGDLISCTIVRRVTAPVLLLNLPYTRQGDLGFS